MQALSLTVCLCVLLVAVWAAPSDMYSDDQPSELGVRLPRATCDLLSITISGNSLGHAACAAHCLSLRRGFRGGQCKDGVCHCRK